MNAYIIAAAIFSVGFAAGVVVTFLWALLNTAHHSDEAADMMAHEIEEGKR